MVLAGKAYYDGVAKIGEIATGSPVSTELGELTLAVCKPDLSCGSRAFHPVRADGNAGSGRIQLERRGRAGLVRRLR